MSESQKAFQFDNKLNLIKEIQVPIPEPQENEILLKIRGSGVCHTDSFIKNGLIKFEHNFIGGHEFSGEIFKIGKNLSSDFKVGDKYCVNTSAACFKCEQCFRGEINLCKTTPNGLGTFLDGGWQQYVIIKDPRWLVKIPENVSMAEAAVISDSVLSPYHAIKKLDLNILDKVLVIGAGGLGMNAIQILKAFNVQKIEVLELKSELKDDCLKHGATDFFTDITKKSLNSYDAVIDLVGLDSTFDIGIQYLKPNGKLSSIGVGIGKINFDSTIACIKEIQIFWNFYGTIEELKECLELTNNGLVKPNYLQLPFDDVNKVVDDLTLGKFTKRVVFDPNE